MNATVYGYHPFDPRATAALRNRKRDHEWFVAAIAYHDAMAASYEDHAKECVEKFGQQPDDPAVLILEGAADRHRQLIREYTESKTPDQP